MKQKLAARIERLEQQAHKAVSGPLFILITGPEPMNDENLAGYMRQDGEAIHRRPWESAAALRKRIASGLVRPELFFEIGAPPHRS